MIVRDKLLHFAAGAAAAIVGWIVGASAGISPTACGAIASAVAAVGREVYNSARGGAFDWADVAATLAGGASLLAVAALSARLTP